MAPIKGTVGESTSSLTPQEIANLAKIKPEDLNEGAETRTFSQRIGDAIKLGVLGADAVRRILSKLDDSKNE
jgi:hypothetical protein